MDLEYWESYYKKNKMDMRPSPFANFLTSNYKLDGNIIELGCGNGRDAVYFAKNGSDVIGVDQCQITIDRLNKIGILNTKFIADDFTNLSLLQEYHNIYSRFTLHSIDSESELRTIKWASKVLNSGVFAIEVRSVKDDLFGQGELIAKNTWFTDHARRFVNFEEIKNILITNGFYIIYEEESRGLAPYKNEDPVVIRIIAKINVNDKKSS